ncbi:MAG TPA: hypothetical protein PLY93_01325, partial [Turneriella sp.]|nr:hypothetical protein [Turneriella sp.]
EATYRLIPNRNMFNTRFLDRVIVKGKSEPIPILEILDGKNDIRTERKLTHRAKFEEGAYAFHAGKADIALKIFQELSAALIEDPACELYLERCQLRIAGKKIEGVDEEYKKKAL